MKSSAGILSYEIYNQEGKNELSVSTQANYTQLLKLKLRNSSPYHQILFKKTKTPHLTLKFKKGVLPKGFKSNHIKIHKYRLIKGSDLFSQSALEGYLFDKAKMEKDENFQVDVQTILDSIDDSQATRNVVMTPSPFGIDMLLTHFQKLNDKNKLSDEDKKTYEWVGKLGEIQASYQAALSDIRKLTLSNDVIKANPLFTSIIQEAATVFEKLTNLQENSAKIERNLESLAQQVHEQQKADIQSLEANFQNNYKKSTKHLIDALKTNLKAIIVDALHGTKIKDITNLKELTIDEDIIKTLERKVFVQAAVVNSDWTVNIIQKEEEDSITFTCTKDIQLAPNEYLLMDFELIGALRGTAKSVVTELSYSKLVFQKNGIEDTSVKDKLSQSVLNLVNDGTFGMPPALELLVGEGKNILNNGQYENTIKLNLINKGLDNITLTEASKLRLSFYNQQENETVAYALQGKDDVLSSVNMKSSYYPKEFSQVENSDIFNLVKNKSTLDTQKKEALLATSDKNLLLQNIDLSEIIATNLGSNRFRKSDSDGEGDTVVNRIYCLLGSNKNKAFRLAKKYFAIYGSFSGDYSFNGAYVFELDYKKGGEFCYNIYYKDIFNYDFKAEKFIDPIASTEYLGRIKVVMTSNGKDFITKLGIEEVVNAKKLISLGSAFESVQADNQSDIKDFLQKNKDIISNKLELHTGSLNSIGSTFQNFDAIFYKNYTIATKANSNKTIQYTGIIGVKKVSDNVIEIYQPTPTGINGARDLETYEIPATGFKAENYLSKMPVVTEGMELVGTFWLSSSSKLLIQSKQVEKLEITNDLILSTLPNYDSLKKVFNIYGFSDLDKLENSSTIQTTYENQNPLTVTLAPSESLELILNGVKTQLSEGEAILKISLLNIPNYKDAHLSATVNRVSYLNTNNKGIFTTGQSNNNLQIIQDTIEVRSNNFAIHDNVYKIMPTGSIIMWYGETDKIPGGWKVCDGSLGTPDLRDKFVVGAGSTYKKGDTGGKDKVQLSTNEMPSHTHGMGAGGNHYHNVFTGVRDIGNSYDSDSSGRHPAHWDGSTYQNTNSSGDHKHAIYNAGGGGFHENRPPYYALYYIMRVDN